MLVSILWNTIYPPPSSCFAFHLIGFGFACSGDWSESLLQQETEVNVHNALAVIRLESKSKHRFVETSSSTIVGAMFEVVS